MTTEEYKDFNDSKDSIPENNTADVDSSQNDNDISNYKKNELIKIFEEASIYELRFWDRVYIG